LRRSLQQLSDCVFWIAQNPDADALGMLVRLPCS
jgi:hypothetical protein